MNNIKTLIFTTLFTIPSLALSSNNLYDDDQPAPVSGGYTGPLEQYHEPSDEFISNEIQRLVNQSPRKSIACIEFPVIGNRGLVENNKYAYRVTRGGIYDNINLDKVRIVDYQGAQAISTGLVEEYIEPQAKQWKGMELSEPKVEYKLTELGKQYFSYLESDLLAGLGKNGIPTQKIGFCSGQLKFNKIHSIKDARGKGNWKTPPDTLIVIGEYEVDKNTIADWFNKANGEIGQQGDGDTPLFLVGTTMTEISNESDQNYYARMQNQQQNVLDKKIYFKFKFTLYNNSDWVAEDITYNLYGDRNPFYQPLFLKYVR